MPNLIFKETIYVLKIDTLRTPLHGLVMLLADRVSWRMGAGRKVVALLETCMSLCHWDNQDNK